MKSLLTEFYYGNIHPEEGFSQTQEYKQLNKAIIEEMRGWKAKLSAEELRKMEELHGLIYQSNSIENEQHFSFGFKLAALIMMEVFDAKEKLLGGNT